ncbi:GTPase IMAP family member 6-like [Littorina saxatilis]|uniref:AIG1-type G domain-containing protein n=1 Tax=Littorina saxatilis TaxID=31220 RepID=A0AAN9GAB7_9CAEN
MDAGAEQHQGESHLKITGTDEESEMSNAKGTTGSDQTEQGDAFKPQSERESPSKEITEPDQPFEPAQPCLTTISKSSGMEPDLTAEDPDVLQRKETQGETGYEPETKQKDRGVDQELDRRQEPESDESQEQKLGETQEQELYRRQGQELDNGQEHESDQRQKQKRDERLNQGKEQETEQTQDVESEQRKEEDSEPRGYSDSGSTTQLLPQHGKRNKDQSTDKDKDKKKFKIFVIGKTGTGKSSLCNKIIGRNVFATGRSFKQVTTETQEEPTTLPRLNITVVDTPDISDKSETCQKNTVKSWRDSAKDYNYMVVLAVRCDARYSPAEYEVYRQIKQLWGNDLVKKLVVAFTFGDTREDPGLDMKKELEEVWPELKHVIKDANNRHVVFNNEPGNTDEKPVNELIEIMKHLEDGKLWKWVASGITVTLSGFIIWFMWVDM